MNPLTDDHAQAGIWSRLKGGGQTVLVADDHPDTRAFMASLLVAHGYAVDEAEDGFQALERSGAADLLLLDVRMPGVDGLEVCRRLRGQEPTRFLPIIVVTALGERKDRVAAMEAGADDFLAKPVDSVEVLVRTRSMLRAKEFRDANDRLRSELTSMLVHDLRTPLTTISGFLELIEEERAGNTRRTHIRRALDAVNGMRRIVEDILDVSVLEAGRVAPDIEDVDLACLLEELLRSLEPMAVARHLEVKLAIAPDLGQVRADAYRLGRALTNLVHNAMKFATSWVRISTSLEGDSGVIRVEDDGPGVALEELPLLFKRFTQTATGRSLGKGSGLGLAIARLLVEGQGGRIWAERLEARGMAFVLVLPAVSAIQAG